LILQDHYLHLIFAPVKMRRLFLLTVFAILMLTGLPESHAQCSMCRQVAESNLKQGENKRGRGLNTAILYLMSVPYIMGGVGGYLLWRNRRR
jgi:hypothetical protein